jgi:prolyl-tRNA synthetase
VLPPKLAPIQVVIVPIYKTNEELNTIREKVYPIISELKNLGITVKLDDDDKRRPGFKFADYELKGVPVRMVLGARDIQNNTVEIMRRDTLEKETLPIENIANVLKALLDDIQTNCYTKAKNFRDAHIYECTDYEDFKKRITEGGFFLCPWDGTAETEAKIKDDTQATIRCIPFNVNQENLGVDMVSGKPAKYRALIARAY